MPEHLHKSAANKVFAGVCGGLAEYFKVDATLIRLGWAMAVFIGGTGLILYILAAIIMPQDPAEVKTAVQQEESVLNEEDKKDELSPAGKAVNNSEQKRHQILGLILISLGGYFLLDRFFPFFNMHNWWPIVLIVIGIVMLFKDKGGFHW